MATLFIKNILNTPHFNIVNKQKLKGKLMRILLGVLLRIAMLVGRFIGFISLFTKGDKEARLKGLEKELAKIKSRLTHLEKDQPNATETKFSTAIDTSVIMVVYSLIKNNPSNSI
jgi:flagellar basal body-associated protein FliL